MDPSLLAGRYRRVRMLGRGAMGEVWLAHDELLHRTVAIKSVLATGSDDAFERVVREARLAAKLNHPNAVAVHDLVIDDGRPHVVMEYVAGRSLADEITAAGGGLRSERVRTIGAAVADALAHAHGLGIVHRDVKPANVLVSDDGVPKLADFGIARSSAAPPGTTATGMMVGTPAFLAPEIVHGAKADGRSDIWSLGATLYAALDGRSPFHRSDDDNVFAVLHRVVSETVAPPSGDPATGAVVTQLLRVDPRQRPTAGEVAALLRTSPPETTAPSTTAPSTATPSSTTTSPSSSATSSATTAPTPVTTRRTSRTRLLLPLLVVVLLAIGATTAVVLGTGGDSSPRGAVSAPPRSTPPESARPRSTATVTVDAYPAPGGLTVAAPPGWIRDDSAGIANVRDYRAPDSTDRDTGTYFRIGIANTKPADTIAGEGRGTQQYLERADNPNRARLVRSSTLTFLGVPAIDQEYVGTNTAGVARRFVLRLWVDSGRTLEIEVNAPRDDFTAASAVFAQLTGSARVS